MLEEQLENLIEEVEKRPAIYNKNLKEYTNINIKKQLWEEVCAAVIPNWSFLEGEEKIIMGLEVQKKWKSLRNCFARELRLQKSTKAGHSTHKRRKYIYFDKLLFLLPSEEDRATTSNLDDPETSSESDNDALSPEVAVEERPTLDRRKQRSAPKKLFQESLLQILQQRATQTDKRIVGTDEDVHFALSLVPTLQSLNDYQKLEAKIAILNVLKSIKFPHSTTKN